MKKLLYAVVAAAFLAVCAGAATRSKKSEIAKILDIFNSVFKEVQTFYVDSVDAEKAVGTAIEAMLMELDPYTEYIPQSEKSRFQSLTSGEYGGIGSYIIPIGGNVHVSGPHKGSPAQLAGLRSGDMFVVIDGDSVMGKSDSYVRDKLQGTPGTKVDITVKRTYPDTTLSVTITRKKLEIPSVQYAGIARDSIAFISLSSFTEKSSGEVKDALKRLLKTPGLKGVILDLRGNTGGLLESAVDIVGHFVPKGTEVLRTRGKGILNEKIYKTTSAPIDTEIPLVVLIDGGTASSSEITAGALQDLDRAVIVGNRSFGKGLVQGTRPLPYDGMLKVTMAKYYIPSGRLIQAIDYSHRNPDGSVGRIPDSLTTEFTTLHGRKVRDGGGIVPDREVEYPELSRLVYNIVRDNWAFDFANRFASTRDSVDRPEKFTLTDADYEDFKSTIDPARFNYDKVCETMLSRLRDAAKIEGYMNDSVKAQFDLLEALLKHPLERDLDTHRKSIQPLLEREIAGRFYFQEGEIISQLRNDPGLDSAVIILSDPSLYRSILRPASDNGK